MSTTPARRAVGRPAVGSRVPVRLPPEVLDDIDGRARVLGRSRAAVIRSLLLEALGHVERPDDGVDRAQIRRQLEMTPRERIDRMQAVHAQHRRVRGSTRRRARAERAGSLERASYGDEAAWLVSAAGGSTGEVQ